MTRHSPEQKAEQLLALSKQVNRVAESLAQLALAPAALDQPSAGAHQPDSLEQRVESVIRARRERARYLPDIQFGEPLWDMLLHLLHAEMCDRQASLAAVCRASGHPDQVGLRWLNVLAEKGLVALRPAANSTGTKIVELVPEASSALRRYFDEAVAEQ